MGTEAKAKVVASIRRSKICSISCRASCFASVDLEETFFLWCHPCQLKDLKTIEGVFVISGSEDTKNRSKCHFLEHDCLPLLQSVVIQSSKMTQPTVVYTICTLKVFNCKFSNIYFSHFQRWPYSNNINNKLLSKFKIFYLCLLLNRETGRYFFYISFSVSFSPPL